MEFVKDDIVKHVSRGKGVFLSYGTFTDEAVVQFDEDSDADGDTLTVSTHLLEKL